MQQGIGIKGDHKLGIYMLQSFIQRIKLPGFFFKQDLYVDPQSLSRFQCRFRCFAADALSTTMTWSGPR